MAEPTIKDFEAFREFLAEEDKRKNYDWIRMIAIVVAVVLILLAAANFGTSAWLFFSATANITVVLLWVNHLTHKLEKKGS